MKDKTKTALILIFIALAGIYMAFVGAYAGLEMRGK